MFSKTEKLSKPARLARDAYEKGDRYFTAEIHHRDINRVAEIEDQGWTFVQFAYEVHGAASIGTDSTARYLFRRADQPGEERTQG